MSSSPGGSGRRWGQRRYRNTALVAEKLLDLDALAPEMTFLLVMLHTGKSAKARREGFDEESRSVAPCCPNLIRRNLPQSRSRADREQCSR